MADATSTVTIAGTATVSLTLIAMTASLAGLAASLSMALGVWAGRQRAKAAQEVDFRAAVESRSLRGQLETIRELSVDEYVTDARTRLTVEKFLDDARAFTSPDDELQLEETAPSLSDQAGELAVALDEMSLREASERADGEEIASRTLRLAQQFFKARRYKNAYKTALDAANSFRHLADAKPGKALDDDGIHSVLLAGEAARRLDMLERAERLFREAHSLADSILGSEDPLTSRTANQLALLLTDEGKYAEAEQLYRQTIEVGRASPQTERLVSAATNNLAIVLAHTGRYEESCNLLAALLEEQQSVASPNILSIIEDNLGRTLVNVMDLEGAEAHLRRAHALNPENTAASMHLARVLALLGQSDEAEELARTALGEYESLHGPSHSYTASAVDTLGFVLFEAGRASDAMPLFERALTTRRKVLGNGHPLTAGSLEHIAHARLALGDKEGAQEALGESVSVRENALGKDHPKTVEARASLADLQQT